MNPSQILLPTTKRPGRVPFGVSFRRLASSAGLWTALALPLRAQSITAPILTVTTLAGQAGTRGSADGAGGAARFDNPAGTAVARDGTIYVADSGNNTIRKISSGGAVTTLAGDPTLAGGFADGTGAKAQFNNPRGIVIGPDGALYVADADNEVIRRVTTAGVVTTIAGQAGTAGSADGAAANAQFRGPEGLAFAPDGTLYVADSSNDTIRAISATGPFTVSTLAGKPLMTSSVDGVGNLARFAQPTGIAVAADGTIYVADDFGQTIRKITSGANVTTIAGQAGTAGSADGTGAAARFSRPAGLALDPDGNIYVADSINCTIRFLTPDGVVSTIAGQAGTSGSADGVGSKARFLNPLGLALDSNGNAFIADTSNYTIRYGRPGFVSDSPLPSWVAPAVGLGLLVTGLWRLRAARMLQHR